MATLNRKTRRYPLAIATFLLCSGSVSAANPVLDDSFTFKLGALQNQVDGEVTVARSPLPETPIDLEDILNIDTEEVSPWLAFRWRFSERWALNFLYNRFDQDGSAAVDTEFNLDGVTYPVGARIDTSFRADAYILDVSYHLLRGDNYEVGGGLGLHAFDFDVSAAGEFALNELDQTFDSSSQSLIAPVPNLRLYGTYVLGPRTSITANAGWLSLTYDDYDGAFYYLESHVEYRFSDHWGLGVGAQYTDMDFEHDSGDGDFEKFDITFTGVQGYITYSF